MIALSSSFTLYAPMEHGDLSVTYISTSMFGHVPISSLRLNTSLCMDKMSITSFFSTSERHNFLNLHIFLIYLHLSHFSSHHPYLTMDIFHWILPFPSLMY